MSATGNTDRNAIVIGGGIAGLVAAAALARGGRAVTVIEADAACGADARDVVLSGGMRLPRGAHALFAPDPSVLPPWYRRWRAAERVTRIETMTDSDAANMRRVARALWPVWRMGAARGWPWDGDAVTRARVASLCGLAASDATHEKDWAARAFDAMAGGLSPDMPGSVLALAARIALPVTRAGGGPDAMAQRAEARARHAGAAIVTGTRVTRIMEADGRVCGVETQDGAMHAADTIISSLTARATFALSAPGTGGFAHRDAREARAPRWGEAAWLLALSTAPAFAGRLARGRIVIGASAGELAAAAQEAARGDIPAQAGIEIMAADRPGLEGYRLSVLARPLPLMPEGGWMARAAALRAMLLARLETQSPGIGGSIVGEALLTPDRCSAPAMADGAHMLRPAAARVATSVAGLYLCGPDADVLPGMGGRIGRAAARAALEET